MFKGLKNKGALKDLRRLLEIEQTAIRTYDQLIQAMDLPGPADQLAQFRNEHAKHVHDLSAVLESIGGQGAEEEPERNVAGADVPGTTGGTERALRHALELETLTHDAWNALQHGPVPEEAKELVDRCEDDEDRHLRFVEKLVETRVWELGERTPDVRQ